jgi:hypothetical protein
MLVEVEIITTVMTHEYGTLSTGDILRCSKEYADFLVNDACAAKHKAKPVEKPIEPPVNKAKK